MGVSILVFVELALDAGADQLKQIVGRMFQSLFSWNLLLMGGDILGAMRGGMFPMENQKKSNARG